MKLKSEQNLKGRSLQSSEIKNRPSHLKQLNDKNEIQNYVFNVITANASKINVLVGGVRIKIIVNSGASCNMIDRNLWELMKRERVKCNCYFTDKKLFMPMPTAKV